MFLTVYKRIRKRINKQKYWSIHKISNEKIGKLAKFSLIILVKQDCLGFLVELFTNVHVLFKLK